MQPRTFGRYLLSERLGRGGMAAVFRARDPEFDRDVAIKVLPEDFLHDPEFRSRFQREARSVARLEHPAIVPVYDIGEQEGQPYLVMRFMPGGTLGGKLAQGPLPLPECVAVIRRIASAMQEAHGRGMVHRDIKPGNILFDSYGEAYLSDFGIVKWAQAATTLTGGGTIGTPAYMSPEQSEGRSEIGPAADIYALGVVLFQMISGRLPFEADTPVGLALLHMREAVPQLTAVDPSAPAALQQVIERAMAKRPEDRYPTAGELARALATAAASTQAAVSGPMATVIGEDRRDERMPARPRPSRREIPTLRAPRRSFRPLPLVAVAVFLGLVGAALTLLPRLPGVALSGGRQATPSPEAPPTRPSVAAEARPTATNPPPPSATAPLALSAEDVAGIGLLWSSEVTALNIRFPVRWSPAGDTIAVPDRARTGVELWDSEGGALTRTLKSPQGFRGIDGLAWSPDGSRLAAAVANGAERSLNVWRVEDGEVVLRIPSLSNRGCRPDWSPDSSYVACGAAVYEADSGNLLWAGPRQGLPSAFSPDGSLLALGGLGGDVLVYDAATGAIQLTLPSRPLSALALVWSPKDTLVSGAWNGEMVGWPDASRTGADLRDPFTADSGGVFDLAWGPDGELLLSAHQDHEARLWDRELHLLGAFEHGGAVFSVSWSPDGQRFATGALDGLLRVWGLAEP